MSYRCGKCKEHVEQGSMLKHVEYREVRGVRQIAKETPVCEPCQKAIKSGTLALRLSLVNGVKEVDKVINELPELPNKKEPRIVYAEALPLD